MKLSRPVSHVLYRTASRAALVFKTLALLGWAASPALADGISLAPQTKVRLTIVQWLPSKGEYERWEALGGEHTVSDAGTLVLPFVGSLIVSGLNNDGLSKEIAKRVQERIGLVRTPAVTIEILEYPPIYVVGDVAKPGEYKFRPGLTVLQSLAMGGGPFRVAGQQRSQAITLAGELREMENALVRSSAKLSRLQAEMTGAKEIAFEDPVGVAPQYAAGIYSEEKVIFQARANALERQSKALMELRDLLTSEIETLEKKLKGSDDNIGSAEEQLAIVRTLVEKGAAVASRQLDLERLLTTYRSDRLDLVTAIMRGRQAISETTRNLEGLYDVRRSEVATELQTEKANVDRLRLKRETTQRLLLDDLSGAQSQSAPGDTPPLAFTVSRRNGQEISQFQASDETALVPGDVVTVSQPRISADLSRDSDAPSLNTEPNQASQ